MSHDNGAYISYGGNYQIGRVAALLGRSAELKAEKARRLFTLRHPIGTFDNSAGVLKMS
jgi:hypothetical protein